MKTFLVIFGFIAAFVVQDTPPLQEMLVAWGTLTLSGPRLAAD
jgi:hypothetical protein